MPIAEYLRLLAFFSPNMSFADFSAYGCTLKYKPTNPFDGGNVSSIGFNLKVDAKIMRFI